MPVIAGAPAVQLSQPVITAATGGTAPAVSGAMANRIANMTPAMQDKMAGRTGNAFSNTTPATDTAGTEAASAEGGGEIQSLLSQLLQAFSGGGTGFSSWMNPDLLRGSGYGKTNSTYPTQRNAFNGLTGIY